MMVLGIETATTVCAAAVVCDGELLAEELVDERNVHAERLMGMIDAVFRRSGTKLEQMAGVAVSIGPGSFTGLRIGLSVAKGLVYASRTPLLAVPTLQGLAEKARATIERRDGEEMILPLLDARRGDVYCALYRKSGNALQQIWEQQILALQSLAERLPDGRMLVTGDARNIFDQAARLRFPEKMQQVRIAAEDIARCGAAAVARVGGQLLEQGKSVDPGLLEPQYLREFHTTTH